MRTSDWSSDVCSSDLLADTLGATRRIYALVNEPVPVTNGPGVPRRHRPRFPEGRAGVDPGRGDLAPRRRQRAGAAPRPRPPAGGAYHHGDCSPSLHHPRCQRDRGAGGRPSGRDRHAREPAGTGRTLRPTRIPPARLGLRTGSEVGDLLFASWNGSFPTATISMSEADHGQSVRAIPDGRTVALAGSANKKIGRAHV